MKKEKLKNFNVFCTNIDVTKVDIEYLAEIYRKRWNIENFYRDTENNFMVKTKTADFIIRYFFFLFMSLLYNLWYFIRIGYSITAEEWKDLIEDEFIVSNYALEIMLDMIIQLKLFYYSFFSSYRSIFRYYFVRYSKFQISLCNCYLFWRKTKNFLKIVVVKNLQHQFIIPHAEILKLSKIFKFIICFITMVDIREKIEEDRGILKKIQLIIPGYEGYRRREDIRKADNLLRNQLADKLKIARNDVENLRKKLVFKYETKNLERIGNLLNYFQKIDGQLRHAEHGYSGISPAIRIEEWKLNKLYEFDYSMAKIIEEIGSETAKIKSMNEEEISEEIEKIRNMLEEFEKTFKMRMVYITETEV